MNEDCINIIVDMIGIANDHLDSHRYVAMLLTCRHFYERLMRNRVRHLANVDRGSDHVAMITKMGLLSDVYIMPKVSLVMKYPGERWRWALLATDNTLPLHFVDMFISEIGVNNMHNNINLTYDFFCKHRHKFWNISGVVRHKNITWQHVCNDPDLNIRHRAYEHNPNVTFEILEILGIKIPSDIPPDVYLKCTRESTNVFAHPLISFGLFMSMHQRGLTAYGEWRGISANPGVTWTDIIATISLPWIWPVVLETNHGEMPIFAINIWPLVASSRLPLDFLVNHDKTDWDHMSMRSDLTVDFILKHVNKSWNWYLVSCSITLSSHDVLTDRIPWDINGLSMNKSITWLCATKIKKLST